MGLIRKTFAITAAASGMPVVRMNSKKQRVAKSTLRELQAQTKLMQDSVTAEPPTTAVAASERPLDPGETAQDRLDVVRAMWKQGDLSRAEYLARCESLMRMVLQEKNRL